MGFHAIRNLWRQRWLRASAAGACGIAIAALPALVPSGPVWGIALIASPLLVWYACFSVAELLFPRVGLVSKVGFSLLLYLAGGSVFVGSLALGAWPFTLGRPSLAYLVFAIAWPPLVVWVLVSS